MFAKLKSLLQALVTYTDVQDSATFDGLVYLVCSEIVKHYRFYIPNPKNREHAERALSLFPKARLWNRAQPDMRGFSLFEVVRQEFNNPVPSIENIISFLQGNAIIAALPMDWMASFEKIIHDEHAGTGKGNGKAFSRHCYVFKNDPQKRPVVDLFQDDLKARLNAWGLGIVDMEFEPSGLSSLRMTCVHTLLSPNLFPTRKTIFYTIKREAAGFMGRLGRVPVFSECEVSSLFARLHLEHGRYSPLFAGHAEADRSPHKRPKSIIKAVRISGAAQAKNSPFSVALTEAGYRTGEIEYQVYLNPEKPFHELVYRFAKRQTKRFQSGV